jgi:alpha-glucosidase/lysosomal alpha-glucosidase
MKEMSGKYHIFFYKTASAMDVEYYGETLRFITVGGILHWKLFLGDFNP